MAQALSIDPINAHIIELLNLALESNQYRGVIIPKAISGGERAKVEPSAKPEKVVQKQRKDKGKARAIDGGEADSEMMLG